MNAKLAIEQLYATFAKYGRGKAKDSCSLCNLDDLRALNERVGRVPLRSLVALGDLDLGGHGLSGQPKRFKHFLPRLLEVALMDVASWQDYGLEQIASDLVRTHWLTWPPNEVSAIRIFFSAAFSLLLARVPGRTTSSIHDVRTLQHFATSIGLATADWIKDCSPPQDIDIVALAKFVNEDLPRIALEERNTFVHWLEHHNLLERFKGVLFQRTHLV